MKDGIYRITAGHFCTAFVVRSGRIAAIAPIVKYMIGWPLGNIERYVAKKGWAIEFIQNSADGTLSCARRKDSGSIPLF